MSRTVAGIALSGALYGASVTATGELPAVASPPSVPPIVTASLSFDGADPVISGSVATLFETPVFAGPNRSEKTARVARDVDIVAFSERFEAARTHVAALRMGPDPELARQIAIAQGEARGEGEAPVRVAAIPSDPLDSEGLRAIGALSDPSLPRPLEVPDTLAYARANTPATDFTARHSYSDREQWCMATGIYFEARGESYRGQVAVAQVIMNRVKHANYPDTICGVVYQNQHRRNACQFSFACDGRTNVNRTPETTAWQQAQRITQEVLNEEIYLTEVADSTHYHATYVRPHWARNMTRVTQIGLHVFYRFRPGWRFG